MWSHGKSAKSGLTSTSSVNWIEHFSKLEWIRRYVPPVNEVAVDGKTHRSFLNRKRGMEALHVVGVRGRVAMEWCFEQVKTKEKWNEINEGR